MTALTEFQRLEASGLWRQTAYMQRRDVVVSVGDATLSIIGMDERPLAHWSLPAIERRNPGEMPAIYTPGADAGETLEIDDALMVEAIDRVGRAVRRARPRRGRLRLAVLSGLLAALLVGGTLWLPGALVHHAATIAPPAIRAETGARLLDRIALSAGTPCAADAAARPLAKLSRRLLGPGGGRIAVLPEAVEGAIALPGGVVAVEADLIERYDGPYALAGHILAAATRAEVSDPIEDLLEDAGPVAAIRLMTRGEISRGDLDTYAETLLTDEMPEADPDLLRARFEAVGAGGASYEVARQMTSGPTEPLPETDPPILTDGEWVALQSICGT